MLGRVEFAVNAATGAAPTFVTGTFTASQLQFWVEEAEMLVNLTAKVAFSNSVVERTDFTIFVDGLDIMTTVAFGGNAAFTNGIATATGAGVAGDINTIIAARTVRLPKGQHTMELRAKAVAGIVTVNAATIPCELTAMRNSHIGTLGHGVDSKFQLAQ